MTSPFREWKSKLLQARGLAAPDGRQLYAYRLTPEEFCSLESLLKQKLAQYARVSEHLYQGVVPLGLISEQVAGFPALFVLYSAEWWRQRYDGSGFSWEPILHELGVGADGWNQSQRSACITRGLREWGLSLSNSAGLRYIGTVALQGGLPMRLLAAAKGALGRLLHNVLKEAVKAPATPEDIQNWVRSLDYYLPRTYRQAEIHALLANVIVTVLRLKEDASLSQGDGVIQQLDERTPGWREQFPLPVGDVDAQALIEQLISDAATAKVQRQPRLFVVERRLERSDNGSWQLHSSVILEDTIRSALLASVFETNDELPAFLSLSISAGHAVKATSLRRLAGQEKYRIERRPWGFSGEAAAEEHILTLSASDGRTWSASAPRGEELDQGMPWVFDPRGDMPIFVRQGGGPVAAPEALVAVPKEWQVVQSTEAVVVSDGRTEGFEQEVCLVEGDVRFTSGDLVCRIRTGRVEGKDEAFEWHGRRLWHSFIRPAMAFLGKPALYTVDESGTSHVVAGTPMWRPVGGKQSGTAEALGPVEVTFPAVGEVKHRSRMLVLPSQARLHFEFGDVGSGNLTLENWGAVGFRVLQQEVEVETERQNGTLRVGLRCPAHQRVPEWLDAEVYWPATLQPARMRLPFPTRGARVFGADGTELPSGVLLSANGLAGIRIVCMGGNAEDMPRMSIEFGLGGKSPDFSMAIRAPAGSVHAEIRLQDFASEIAQLLAMDDRPDAQIQMVINIGNQQASRLTIARYDSQLERLGDRVWLQGGPLRTLPKEALSATRVLVLRLESPGDGPQELESLTSEGVPTGAWAFMTESREPGSWLIYPPQESPVTFRPTLWPVSGDQPVDGGLARAIGVAQHAQREAELDNSVNELFADYCSADWGHVEILAAELGHLPLVTLDLWRRIARAPDAMVALLLRFSSLSFEFVDRFAAELPFSWETVPFRAWCEGFVKLRDQCVRNYGDAGEMIFKAHLDGRVAKLTSIHPALHYMLGFARSLATGEFSQEVRAFQQMGSAVIGEMLFAGDQSPVQKLLRIHADDKWPTLLNAQVAQCREQGVYAPFIYPISLGFHDGVINLPIMLAVQVASDSTQEWFADPGKIHELRRYAKFDPDWFAEAMNWTMARCLAAGLLNSQSSQ